MGVTSSFLSVRDVSLSFGGIHALKGVSFDIAPGQICGLIGPNGAGKTTLFNCISRIYRPDSGSIVFDDVELLSRAPHQIITQGISRTFQNVALFTSMTVLENVMLGGHSRAETNPVLSMVAWPGVRRDESGLRRDAMELLSYLDLMPVRDRLAAELPYPTQKRVELARALMSSPKLLLLDEPAGGLSHEEVESLRDLIRRIREERDLTILLVEHHMELVMSISDNVCVLNFGEKIADGPPADVRKSPGVIKAYLGEEAPSEAQAGATH
ncbi:MAG: ATP-binding cassette domain-containing protein [Dehalococcoidia bacterium]|nr:ATP-binding cassette domain-containing protein [Dehalococcoidia bacterium]